ncbi:leukocyte antigen CD37 isoform X2 [Ictalurus furcatus]|nr:leukocyte antigen CD37 isoform X2 [Ictalurus furcatus]XP_053496485.1 leukocyte antigen CD37 isoform X2 [Ictalurus furcatus]XP_053496486.1 leukocyte antigen CD37 isoform X2 [Ictalurus furcatus]
MASELCISVTKYFLFVFNLIFFLLGMVVLGLGVWIICSETTFHSRLISAHPYLSLSLFPYLLVISGSVTLLLGFFGSLGALKEVKCMLATYFILLTVLLAAQIIGTVLIFTQKKAFQTSLEKYVTDMIKSFEMNNSTTLDLKKDLDVLQIEAQCCGWTGQKDFHEVPCSCYMTNGTANPTNQSSSVCCKSISNYTCVVYEKNCRETLEGWLNKHLMSVLGVVLAVAVVEICGTILSMCLYNQATLDYSVPMYF